MALTTIRKHALHFHKVSYQSYCVNRTIQLDQHRLPVWIKGPGKGLGEEGLKILHIVKNRFLVLLAQTLFVMVHLKEYRNHARKISFKIYLIFFVWQTYQHNGVGGNFLDRSLLNHKIYSFLFLIKDWHFRPSWPGWRWCRAQWDQSRGTILFPKNGIFNWWQWSMPYNY